MVFAERPNVLCLSGLDPSGGAGLQADIETAMALGCHCLPIATALTVQTTRNVLGFEPVAPTLLIQQARAILEDVPVHCIKIGLVGHIPGIEVIHSLLRDYPSIPVVLDPVLRAGGGFEFDEGGQVKALRELLVPLATTVTPNSDELNQLVPCSDVPTAAEALLALGCTSVLVTGTHADTTDVVNRLYRRHVETQVLHWPRLPHVYHGSGCTLASAVAAGIAHGLSLPEASHLAQRFTWSALNRGRRVGLGQWLPERTPGYDSNQSAEN